MAAALALSGLLGASTFGTATAIHVDLEHDAGRGAAGHAHQPGLPTTEGHAHPHAPAVEASDQSPLDPGRARRAEAPEHDHILALSADLDRRTDRSPLERLSHAAADATRALVCAALSSPHRRPSRASPAARASPRSRRSVVLQV